MNNSNQFRNSDLFHTGQIKLAEISAYNWGSFSDLHTARIDPEGTLITGDNGAGKTTLIDGLMALLLPAGKANFNRAAAQDDRSDRNLVSYIRGSYGTAHDGHQTRTMYKRIGAVVCGLRACYFADDGSKITLAALFWMTQSSNALSDLKRIYVVAKRDLLLEEMLQAFGEGNTRSLNQFLRDDQDLISCESNFSEYQETYRRLLNMENQNAPALLSRALGLKKIDDLTFLIRELVLEPGLVREDVRKAVLEFEDLEGIYNRLLDARAQRDTLKALPDIATVLQKTQQEIMQLNAEQNGLAVYFGEQCHRLWTQQLEIISNTLTQAQQQLRLLQQQATDKNEQLERLHVHYSNLGGNRIEEVKKDLRRINELLATINKKAAQYQKIATELKLNSTLNETAFQKNSALLEIAKSNIEAEIKTAQNKFADAAAKLSTLQLDQKNLEDEIRDIEARPDSNIETRFQQLRDELCLSLQLDQEQLMFVGELIDVKDEDRIWQGAIERALGGLRTTLLVKDDNYSLITRWLNQRHTGLHVRVQVVRAVTGNVEFKSQGYLRKLQWRKHDYREWLKQHLRRFDLSCVSNADELNNTPFSITQQGLIQFDKGRFEKKDRQNISNQRFWQLGFSNKIRLKALKISAQQLIADLESANKNTELSRTELNTMSECEQLWNRLEEFQWQDIDVTSCKIKQQTIKEDLAALQKTGSDLDKARISWEQAKKDLSVIQDNKSRQDQKIGGLISESDTAKAAQQKSYEISKSGLDDELRELLSKRVGELGNDNLQQASQLETIERNKLEKQKDQVTVRKTQAGNRAVTIMTTFYSHENWQAIAVDWGHNINSIDEYLQYLDQLQEEGLPELVEQFNKRLNQHTTQSLAGIRSRMDSEREEITDRISIINKVLERTEFRPGSFLKLGIQAELYPHVQDFNAQLKKVFAQAGSDDHESRFQNLRNVIEILDKASHPVTAKNKESLRLLEPRFQMSFFAEEIDNETNEIRDVLMSSSGKSGGEKEAFAGTIVAASLAYVLTPDGSDRPIYCTVFLDEAFSNTAEAVSRRVLRVFRELHIHINLITPYKNLNLARESARSLLIAERDTEQHESHLCEVTWDEIDEMQKQSSSQLKTEALQLGIELPVE